MHYGAKNGNFDIVKHIVEEATRLKIIARLVNKQNELGFTPLIEVAMRGYHLSGDKDRAIESRYKIIESLVKGGADANYSRAATRMSALHWLAHNNDEQAIKSLLNLGADHLMLSHDKLLPIDVAGSTPSFASLDAFLDQFQKENGLNPQENNAHSSLKGLNDFVVPTETA